MTIFAKAKADLVHGVMSDAKLAPVLGPGDRAAYGGPELDVLFGSRVLVLESSFGPVSQAQAQLVALAKAELARLR
ncbi:MAG TPA: hypothetical protein VH478_01680 [Trebonia sp.]|nr:hypothetical protein [Trebonia sp.]